MATFVPAKSSAAVQIVRPPSPSSEPKKDKEKENKSPDKRETPQRICRNVMIYGYCKYQDQGCAYSHPPPGVDPSTPQTTSPAMANLTPATKQPATGIGMEHLSAPVFVPKTPFESASPRAHTPAVASRTSTPPVWPALGASSSGLLPAQPFSPAIFTPAPASVEPTYEHPIPQHPTPLPNLDPSAIDQTAPGMYLPPRQPLDHHLYTAPLPHASAGHPGHPHSFFVTDDLRRLVQARQEAVYVGSTGSSAPGLPQELGVYHTLTPLPISPRSGPTPPSKVYGLPSPLYRATSEVDGNAYCLRRVEGFKLVNEAAFGAVDTWRRMRHPNIVGLKEAFTTKGFGDNSLVLVYDFHPLAKTLSEEHISPPPSVSVPGQPPVHKGPIPERIIWSYLTQLSNALKAIHSSSLAVRNLDPSKILVTGKNRIRLNCVGLVDVLAYDNSTPISVFQQEDLVSLGKLVLALTCDFYQPGLPPALALDHLARFYSSDLKNLVVWLIGQPGQGQGKTIDDVVKMMGPRILNELDAMQSYTDTLESELGAEVENGRIVRLLIKFGFINERAEFELDPRWSDTGDRYILKLFRDYVFHSTSIDGSPVLDLSHVLVCLNKLDVGLDERVMLVSRDDQSCLVVSYREIKHCLDAAFNELRNSSNPMRILR